MSHGGYGKGCFGSYDVTAPRNYKPLIAFVLIDELIFLAGAPLAGRLGFQTTFTTILWAVTILTAIVLWRMRFFRNSGFRAWLAVVVALIVGHFL